jgi:hypothetical protein
MYSGGLRFEFRTNVERREHMEDCMVPKFYKVYGQTSHVLPDKPVYNGRK